MKREHIIRLVAGTMILGGLSFHLWWHPAWIILPALVGLNLLQSSLTKWCLLDNILRKYNIGKATG